MSWKGNAICNILQIASKFYHRSWFEKIVEEKIIDERLNVSLQLLSPSFCENEGHKTYVRPFLRLSVSPFVTEL